MEQIKNYLPMALLCLLVTKCIIVGAEYSDMGIAIALIGYLALMNYVEKHKKVQEVIEVVNKQNDVIKNMAEQIDMLKTSVAGVKLSAGFNKKL